MTIQLCGGPKYDGSCPKQASAESLGTLQLQGERRLLLSTLASELARHR